MNSDSQTASSVPSQIATVKPRAEAIAAALKDAADPLSFIQANLQATQPQIDPNAVVKQVEEQRAAASSSTPQSANPNTNPTDSVPSDVPLPDINLTGEEPKSEEAKPAEGAPAEDAELADEPKNTTAENFKRLRQVMQETKKVLSEREAKLKEAEDKLKLYETGEILPDALQELQTKVSEYEKYKNLVDLKTSPQYNEKYVRPLNQIQDRLGQLAKDYEIPPEQLAHAMTIGNEAELNRFLSSHFDSVGAIEVKQLINQARAIQTEAKEAEKAPQNALEEITREAERMRQERRKSELQVMSQSSKDAWMDSLLKIREEGDAVELIHKQGDTEYNSKIVNPIIAAAAREYGKLVTLLSQNGLEKLPKDLAFALARMCQLAHASGVAAHTRNEAVRQAEAIEQNVKRTTSYVRPQIGASNGHGAAPAPKQPASPTEAAETLLNQVMGGKNV